ncbi:MAG: hypothetical protein JWQ19_2965 [Subtercola sp.]|nr:hypothetical protein [Subtercola sp.]
MRSGRLAVVVGAVTALALGTLAACGSGSNDSAASASSGSGGSGTTTTLSLAHPSPVVSADTSLYFSTPESLGFWNGLDVKHDLMNGVDVINAVALGKDDVGIAPTPNVIDAVAKGTDIQSIYTIYPRSFSYPAAPENSNIKSAKDLEGKTVAALSLQATSAIQLTKASVAAAGGDPSKVQFVAIDQGAPALEALKSGRIQALAMYTGAYANMKTLGMPMRSLQAPQLGKLGFSFTLIAKPGTIASKHDAIVKLLRGIAETYEFAKANPKAAAEQWLKDNPTMKPANLAQAQAVQGGVNVITGALKDAAPYTDGQWGSEGKDVVQYTEDAYKQAGVVQGTAPVDKLWTDKLIADANNFDHASVQKKAKAAG